MEDSYEDANEDNKNNNINNINKKEEIKNDEIDNSKIIRENQIKKENFNENEIINEEENKKLSSKEIPEVSIKPIEHRDTIKIMGDEEIKTNFNNNAYYLGNLFMDIVNKYNGQNDLKVKRRLVRNTITKKKKEKKEEPKAEDILFNFNDIINVQLNEVKQNTLAYLDKAKIELDKRYCSYIIRIKIINPY